MKESDIKKTHIGAKSFALQHVVVQNMHVCIKKCMSNDKLFKKVLFLLIIFLFNSTLAYAGIDEAGSKIYYKLVGVGKWVITFLNF